MDNISDKDKLGMAALIASVGKPKEKLPLPKPRPPGSVPVVIKRRKITPDAVKKGLVSQGDANDAAGYKSGGMIDRAAMKGHTKGKIC